MYSEMARFISLVELHAIHFAAAGVRLFRLLFALSSPSSFDCKKLILVSGALDVNLNLFNDEVEVNAIGVGWMRDRT